MQNRRTAKVLYFFLEATGRWNLFAIVSCVPPERN